MKELMVSLMVWASAHTGLPMPADVPTVEFMDRCAMQRQFVGDPEARCDTSLIVIAMYDPNTDTVSLTDKWRPDNLVDLSSLLHELTHYMQDEAGMMVTAECVGELERVAYDTENAWLAGVGPKGLEVPTIDPISLKLLTSCEQNPWRKN